MKTINLEIQVPDWVRWVARDSGGRWVGYANKPTLRKDEGWWIGMQGSEITLTIEHEYNTNWQQSLMKV